MTGRKKDAGKAGILRGHIKGQVHPALDRINKSFDVDRRLWREDIAGSKAHARMLGAQGILAAGAVKKILKGLDQVAAELDSGTFVALPDDEDVHMAVERRLTELIGPDGKRLHVGRSRNDQVATDLRLYLVGLGRRVADALRGLEALLAARAAAHASDLVPYYTHLQRAQPVTLGHVLLAWVEMLDPDRLALDAVRPESPLGAGAGAGTTFPLDRAATAAELGLSKPARNSIEAVSSRRDAVLVLAHLASAATTLSRLGADLVLWTSREFGFARLDDSVSTGSSIMPQKRNPDGAELLRAKAAVVSGALARLLEIQRALPLGYAKDLQEDKPAVFEAEDAVLQMIEVAEAMLSNVTFDVDRMRAAVVDPSGYMLATEMADFLVVRGVPFREAYQAVGQLVREAERRGVGLEALTDADYAAAHPALDATVRRVLDPDRAVARRRIVGGPAPSNVRREARAWSKRLGA
ncbi:MAG: argininosuccinate lyase [Planctomycetota bacterium]